MAISAFVWAVIAVVASTAISVAMSIKQKQEMEDAQSGLLIQKQGGTHPIPIVYGKRRIAPTKVWEDISTLRLPVSSPSTSADSYFVHQEEATYKSSHSNKNFLHRIDVYCQGPVSLISNIEVDDDPVNTHKRFTQTRLNRPIFRALNKHGSESQTMFSELSSGFSGITQSMKGNGVAWAWNSFLYAKDDPQYYGNPQLTALVTGLLVWDPRVNPSDSSIKAWSDNPALVLLDYLTADYGKGLAVSDLDIPSFVSAANECDVMVTLPAQGVVSGITVVYNRETGEYDVIPDGGNNPNGNSTGSQKRFTCNIALQPDVDSKENVAEILKTFKGSLPYINGQYVLSMELAGTSVMAFDDTNIIDGVSLSYGDRSKRLNQVTVKFPNALKGYKEDAVTWPVATNALYTTLLAEDSGEKLTTEAKLSGVTSYSQAEDLAEFMVRDSRKQQVISFKTQPLAMQLEPNDIITVTTDALSYTDRPYRVREVKLANDLTVEIVAQEYDATVYPWYVGDPEPAPEYVHSGIFDTPADIQNLQAVGVTLLNVDTTANTNVVVTWDTIESNTTSVDIIQVGYKIPSATEYSWSVIPSDQTEATLVGLQDNTTYDIVARYRNLVGNMSNDVVVSVTTPDANTGFTDGVDGVNSYLHIAYADDVNGNGFSQSPTGKDYIGTYSDSSVVDSTTASDYTWSLYVGADGVDGDNAYIHIAYADDVNGNGFSQSPTGKDYIGTYSDSTVADSSTASDYTWTLYVGADGVGIDGDNAYLHIAYADDVNGSGFNQSPTGKDYIGTYTDSTLADSTTASDYTWSLYVGTDGVNGDSAYLHIAYADDVSGNGFSTSPTGKGYIGTYTDSNATASTTASDYTWAVYAGTDGDDGTDAGRTAKGIIYFQTEQAGTPTTPTITAYDFATGVPTISTSGWGLAPLTVTEDGGTYWAASYQAIEAELNGAVTLSTTAAYQTHSMDGLVTFTNLATDLASTGGNITTISGGLIKTDGIAGGTVPDSDAPPSGSEQGSFFDLDDGTFVVGNSNSYIYWNGSVLDISGVTPLSDFITVYLGQTHGTAAPSLPADLAVTFAADGSSSYTVPSGWSLIQPTGVDDDYYSVSVLASSLGAGTVTAAWKSLSLYRTGQAPTWTLTGGSFPSMMYSGASDTSATPSNRSDTILADISTGTDQTCTVTVSPSTTAYSALTSANISITVSADSNGTFSISGKTLTTVDSSLKRIDFTINHSTSGLSTPRQCFLSNPL